MNQSSENEVKEALTYISADDRDTWIKVGMALKSGGFDVSIYNDWSATSEKYKDGEPVSKWKSFKKSGISIGTLFYLARQNGYTGTHGRYIEEYVSSAEAERQPSAAEYILPDMMDRILQFHDALLGNTDRMRYLTVTRQIPVEILEKYKIGFSQNGFNDCFVDQGKISSYLSKHYTTIFPFFDSDEAVRYVIGEIDDRSKVNRCGEPLFKYCKPKDINQPVFNSRYLKTDIKTIFITEGLFDALSIEAVEYPCMALAGTSYGAFTDDLKRYQVPKDRTFIICLDNDETGRKAAQAFKKELDALGYFSVIHHFSEKDANEAWCADPVSFCTEINEVAESAQSQFLEWLSAKEKAMMDAEQDASDSKPSDSDLQSLSDMKVKTIDWLIPGYVPQGSITILAGVGGTGKTSIWCSIVASVSNGEHTILDDSILPLSDNRKVLFFSKEDSVEAVLLPRLMQYGADMKNIRTLSMDNPKLSMVAYDSDFLKKQIEKECPALVVFDPLQSFMSTNADMAKRNVMRSQLNPLTALGEKYGTAFLIVMHCNKLSGVYGRQRMADSSDIWDIARSVLICGKNPDNEDQVYVSHEKCNYAKPGRTVILDMKGGIVSRYMYDDRKDRDFVEATTKGSRYHSTTSDEFGGNVQTAKNIILSALSDANTALSVDYIDSLLKDTYSCSVRVIAKAKAELRESNQITTKREGKGGRWFIYPV